MDYQLTQGNTIRRLLDDAHIPLDPSNRDYQNYLAWLEKGNEPLPTPAPTPPVKLTIEQKLASVGLTVDDLKNVLGLS